MKRVIVTGGCGFIGSAVIGQLKQGEYSIRVIDNLSFGNRDFVDLPESAFDYLDIRDGAALEECIVKFDPHFVIHLAAVHFIPYCNQYPYESADINIRGTMHVLDACKKVKSLERVFFASTAAVYPIVDGPISESASTGPLDIYGLSKLTGERLCNEFFNETKLPVTICRFFNAFGPNETNPHLIPEIERQLKEGQRTIKLGNLTPKRDFIHTHDMARAVEALLVLNEPGCHVYNLGRGIEYSVTEIVESFERVLGEKIQIEVDPLRVRKVERMHLLADVSKLKRATGWLPQQGIDDGVKTLMASKAQVFYSKP